MQPSELDDQEEVSAETSLLSRQGLPIDATWMRELFAPATWRSHPNYPGLAAFWQQVHNGLRSEAAGLDRLLAVYREEDHDPRVFERAFLTTLQSYLGHLQAHHQIEDGKYFPRFRELDPRLAFGFDLLEADHELIHEQLVEVVDSGRALLEAIRAPRPKAERELDAHAGAAQHLTKLLDRHLADEEDLVIPVILTHGDDAAW